MNNKEINSLIESLNASMWVFENYMVENDGVCDEASYQMEEIKGANGYKFQVTTSIKTEVDKEILKELFLDKVEKKLRGGKNPVIPADVTFSLGASVSLVPEGAVLPSYYKRTSSPSCKFSKPRASKEVK